MPSASRIGDSTLPHECWSGGVISAGSPDVLINGAPAARIGDPGTPHQWTCPDSNIPHGVVVSSGSGSVLINGSPSASIGGSCTCGSTIGSGSSDVIVGG